MAWLTAAGVVLAAISHFSVSRHMPPPGWGLVFAGYEILLPCALLIANTSTDAHVRVVAAGVAAVVASAMGIASFVVAGVIRPIIVRHSQLAVDQLEREDALRLVSVERRRLESALRRSQHPPVC